MIKEKITFDTPNAEKMTFIDLLSKIRQEDTFPIAIKYENEFNDVTFEAETFVSEEVDWVDYFGLFEEFTEELHFNELFTKKVFIPIYYKRITYLDLLIMIQKGTQPKTIVIDGAKYNYVGGNYWRDRESTLTSSLSSKYTTEELLKKEIRVYGQGEE